MKPAWDQLMEEFKDSSSVVVGDVDCTVETDLCSDYGVSGYPTIKYFTAETDEKGDAYNGGRDFDSLKAHVEDKLQKLCSVEDTVCCQPMRCKLAAASVQPSPAADALEVWRSFILGAATECVTERLFGEGDWVHGKDES